MCVGQIEGVLLPPLGGLAPCDNRAVRPPSLTLPHRSLRPARANAARWGGDVPSLRFRRRALLARVLISHPSGGDDMAQRSGPTGRLESRALLLRFPPARDLDFLRPTQSEHGAPRISGFWTVGFVWDSLDSLVRNEPFQWVTSDPRPIFNSRGHFPPKREKKTRPDSIRRSTALNPLAKQKPLGAPGSWQSISQGSDRALGRK